MLFGELEDELLQLRGVEASATDDGYAQW